MSNIIGHLIIFAAVNLLILLLGYTVIKSKMLWIGWLLFATAIPAIYIVFVANHPIFIMLAIIATTFSCMKVIAVAASYNNKPLTLSFKNWMIYAIGWVGMRAEPFETLGDPPLTNAWPMVRFGFSRIFIGLILIFAKHFLIGLPLPAVVIHIIVSVVLLIGFSLILHFGLLGISAGMWRYSGVNTYLLFRQPIKALSLTEFWSKRWNIAFSEMTSVAIFRPLKKLAGSPVALMAAFIFSGFLHELALSVPVKSGFGLPTVYFIIQALVVLSEKFMAVKKISFLNNKDIAHAWVFFWVVMPAPLLFHPEFTKQIVWPLAGLNYNF